MNIEPITNNKEMKTTLPIEDYKRRYGHVTYENIQYGQLLNFQKLFDGRSNGIYTSAKAQFFNRKGVLVGHDYEFVSYEMLAQRECGHPVWERVYMGNRLENIQAFIFERVCRLITILLKWSQTRFGN